MMDQELRELVEMITTGIVIVVLLAVAYKLGESLGQSLRGWSQRRPSNTPIREARVQVRPNRRIRMPLWEDPRYWHLFQIARDNNRPVPEMKSNTEEIEVQDSDFPIILPEELREDSNEDLLTDNKEDTG